MNPKTRFSKQPVTVIFKDKRGIAFAKTYFSSLKAKKAAAGLKTVGSHPVGGMRVAKGFKFGNVVKRMNRGKSTKPKKSYGASNYTPGFMDGWQSSSMLGNLGQDYYHANKH